MSKIVVVGAGNAGCLTALQFGWYTDHEVELIYDSNIPSEPVGQATLIDPPRILWATIGFDWYSNSIHATPKSGILYKDWGKVNEKIFHNFPADRMAMHYCPWEMQQAVLESGHFKVTESNILEPKDVDADYVFDCRGKPDDFSDYDELINPINAAILGKPNWDTTKDMWSSHIATPDGWTFIIPSHKESPSYNGSVGYCYNSNITSKEDAENNFLNMFDVDVTRHLTFTNYVAKKPIVDGRIFLNGNRLCFLEAMESTAVQTYMQWVNYLMGNIINKRSGKNVPSFILDLYKGMDELDAFASWGVRDYIRQIQNFILWHYQFGSRYDTPFWKYAQSLSVDNRFKGQIGKNEEDTMFYGMVDFIKDKNWCDVMEADYGGPLPNSRAYGQWNPYSFKTWYDGMNVPI